MAFGLLGILVRKLSKLTYYLSSVLLDQARIEDGNYFGCCHCVPTHKLNCLRKQNCFLGLIQILYPSVV